MMRLRILGILMLLARMAWAHDVGLSTATVRLQSDALQAELTFARRDVEAVMPLDTNKDGLVSSNEFASALAGLKKNFTAQCPLRYDADTIDATKVDCILDGTNNVLVRLDFPGRKFTELELRFDVIQKFPAGHRLFVTLLGPAGETLAERLLNQESPSINIVLDSAHAGTTPEAPQTFVGFLKLGLEHIGTGYDHLLFLFGLLLVARGLRSSLLIITSFTVAHTFTLGMATLGWFALRPSLTEPLIALSIVYVGAENLLCHGKPKGRWLLTFGFGLIHGFGFASVLRDLGVGADGSGVVMPLLAFNLGVELGQLTIAAVALPIIWQLGKADWFKRQGITLASIGVTALGAWWFLQRVWL